MIRSSVRPARPARPAALVLDVDGVVLHAPRALGRVAQRATDYVQRELGLTDRRYAKRVNKLLYGQHGHTLLGLRDVFGARLTNAHFAAAVYDPTTLGTLADEAARSPDVARRFQELRGVLLRATERDVPVYLFSNAPAIWTRAVCDLGKLGAYIPPDRVLSSDHDVFAGTLKPDPRVYQNLEDHIGGTGKASASIVFVDDSYVNLLPTLGRWTSIYFNPRGPAIATPALTTIKRTADIGNLL